MARLAKGELGAFFGEMEGRTLVIVDTTHVVPDDPCPDDAVERDDRVPGQARVVSPWASPIVTRAQKLHAASASVHVR